MKWTSPDDLRAQVRRLWDTGRLPADIVDEIAVRAASAAVVSEDVIEERHQGPSATFDGAAPIQFPLALKFRAPDPQGLASDFAEVRSWIKALEAGSKSSIGHGYEIVWRETNNRLLGRNECPSQAVVPARADALALIHQTDAADRLAALTGRTLLVFPGLAAWLRRNALAALGEHDAWERILAVLAWFRAHPRSGLYIRQIDVPGVDTKFIESRKPLLAALLDSVLPASAVETSRSGATQFEARYGLASKPALVRVRILDPDIALAGLTDITVRADELARLDLRAERVFIVENETTGLAFPSLPRAIVVMGLGYAVDLLGGALWLDNRDVCYWGDIDTHGFAILDRLRTVLPHARSLLMDRDTLLSHRAHWTREDVSFIGPLERLTPPERALYDDLRFDRLGQRVRLEQERISFVRLITALST